MVIVIASLSICIALISGDTGDKHYKATCNENFWNACGRRDGDNCVNYSRGCEISIGSYDTLYCILWNFYGCVWHIILHYDV